MRLFNSDELGEKGETWFSHECANARLNSNKSGRDRAGWDFIVDFPAGAYVGAEFDSRPPPLSCMVQVKAINEGKKSAVLNLAMAERLAKQVKPSFICVPVVDASGVVIDCYLIHLAGDRLAKVLGRLRAEIEDSEKPLNKKKISFTVLSDERVDPSGPALKAAMERHAGNDMHDYATRKKIELATLGFEGAPFVGSMRVEALSLKEIAKSFLGIGTPIVVKNFEVDEVRFGIKRKHASVQEGLLSIQPNTTTSCFVRFSGEAAKMPITLPAKVSAVSESFGLGGGYALVKGDFFYLLIEKKEGVFNIDFGTDGADQKNSSSDWRRFFALSLVLGSKPAYCDIYSDSSQIYGMELNIESSFGARQYENFLLGLDCVDRITKQAGMFSPLLFTVRQLIDAMDVLWSVNYLIDGEYPKRIDFSGEFDADALKVIDGQPLVFAYTFDIFEMNFALFACGIVNAASDGDCSIGFNMVKYPDLMPVNDAEHFEKILQAVQDREGINGHIANRSSI